MRMFPLDASPACLAASAGGASQTLTDLPEWNLTDLYPSMDSPLFAADLKRAGDDSAKFAEDYRGRLDALAREPGGAGLLAAIQRFEALEDLLGRIMSYAGLTYSGDTTDPSRAKFYGDAQEKVTAASTDLLFFTLELNRIEDAVLDAAMATGPTNSRIASSSFSMRSRSPDAAPGTGFSTRPWPHFVSRSAIRS